VADDADRERQRKPENRDHEKNDDTHLEGQVLVDHPTRLAAHRNSEGDVAEIVAYEHHVPDLHRHVGAGGTMAKPTDAVARAGASFTPSPTLAADERFVGALLYERMNGPTHAFDGAGLQHARQREEKQQHRALERMIDDRRSSAASTINRSTSMAFSRKDRRPTSTQKSRP
jgi:hypothetical protein